MATTSFDYLSYIFGFLCVYIFLYILLGIFFQESSHEEFQIILSRSLDIFMSIVVLTVALTLFFSLPVLGENPSHLSQTIQDQIYHFLVDPISIFIVAIGIFILYLIIYLFRIPMTPATKPFTIILLENGSWILFAILIIENFARTFLKIDLVKTFVLFLDDVFDLESDVLTKKPATTTSKPSTVIPESPQPIPNPPPPLPAQNAPKQPPIDGNRVFHNPQNIYTYHEAQDACAAVGATLATEEQMKAAYDAGQDWCNYGWSANQTAFYPTQQESWNKLQANPSTANHCGRPGLNGGYMENPNIRFGVNCYDNKSQTTTETHKNIIEDTQAIRTQPLPLTPEEVAFNEKLQNWTPNTADVNIQKADQKQWTSY
jgi:hypothetical protein